MRRVTSGLLVVSCFTSSLCGAAQVPPDAFDQCAFEQEATVRLACFDRQIAARREVAAQKSARSPQSLPKVATVAATPEPATDAIPQSVPAAPPLADRSDVGLDARQLRQKHPEEAAAKATLATVESTVVKVTERRPLISSFELANGQVWEQIETVGGARVRARENVVIRQNAMGGFMLKSAGGVVVRVRRIK
jgi:hypothetical protein